MIAPFSHKKNLIHAKKWTNLKNMQLSESSQLQKVTCYRIPLIGNVQKRWIYGDREQIARSGGLGERTMGTDC